MTVGTLHVIIDVEPAVAERSAAFWSAALGWPGGDPWSAHPEFRSFLPPDGAPYVHQQIGDHGRRIHIDAETSDLDRETERIVALGATVEPRTADWQLMRSPGGMPFCLVRPQHADRPGPQRWPGGHRTRPVQVCIDIPPRHLDAEVAFWRQATGWRWVPGESPEFVGKLYPDAGEPVHLLLQRLDSDEPATRAHLDVGTDNIEAEVQRLVDLGATWRSAGDGFVVLTDPCGLAFCAPATRPTERPRTSRLVSHVNLVSRCFTWLTCQVKYGSPTSTWET